MTSIVECFKVGIVYHYRPLKCFYKKCRMLIISDKANAINEGYFIESDAFNNEKEKEYFAICKKCLVKTLPETKKIIAFLNSY